MALRSYKGPTLTRPDAPAAWECSGCGSQNVSPLKDGCPSCGLGAANQPPIPAAEHPDPDVRRAAEQLREYAATQPQASETLGREPKPLPVPPPQVAVRPTGRGMVAEMFTVIWQRGDGTTRQLPIADPQWTDALRALFDAEPEEEIVLTWAGGQALEPDEARTLLYALESYYTTQEALEAATHLMPWARVVRMLEVLRNLAGETEPSPQEIRG